MKNLRERLSLTPLRRCESHTTAPESESEDESTKTNTSKTHSSDFHITLSASAIPTDEKSTWRNSMKFVISAILLSITKLGNCQTFLDLVTSRGNSDIRTIPSPIYKKYDFIIIGGGSGGSTVANRLSENPKWNILLIEAGKPEIFLNQIPAFVSNFQQTDYNWGYRVQPQKYSCLGMKERRCEWPRGKSLGGTSTINYMIHTRGNKLDYDEWSSFGNYGWSYDEVLPYFIKSEKFKVPGITNSSYHGKDGYLCVENVPYHSVLATEFLRAGQQLGYEILDYNGPKQIGFSYIQVNMDRGARCSASKAYLTVKRNNLDIVTETQVTRILIDKNNQRAYGVEYVKKGVKSKVYAKKEIILSAGTIDSAKLLMLSGIGPRKHLEELNIDVIKDSKVGYNLNEHVGFLGLTFTVNASVTSLMSRVLKPSAVAQYMLQRSGPISIPGGAEALAFIQTKYAPDSRPDVELLFASGSLASDNGLSLRKCHGLTDKVYDTVYKPLENKDAWSIWPIVQSPRSHGRIRLGSKNHFDSPIIEPNFFTHPADVEIILEGIKHAIDVSRSQPFQAYDSKLHDVKIPGCEKFDFASDDYWRCGIRHLPSMMNHEIGTVKMGPKNDPDAVVDPQLRVYGVKGLRVVDASIMPKMPVGHVNAGIFMIGEKASDMIKESWKET